MHVEVEGAEEDGSKLKGYEQKKDHALRIEDDIYIYIYMTSSISLSGNHG